MKKGVRRKAAGARRWVAAAALAMPGLALACGACIEDKIAAAYDHGVVSAALARGHVVVFAEVEGPVDTQALARSASRVRAIDRASVRSAQNPAAVSFALDPRASTPARALAAMEKNLAGARLVMLKVMR